MLLFLLPFTDDEVRQAKQKRVSELFEKYHVSMVRMAKTRLKNLHIYSYNTDADDMVQNTFMRIMLYIDDIDLSRSESDIRSYIMSMLANVINDHVKNLSKQVPFDEIDEERDSEEEFIHSLNITNRYDDVVAALCRMDRIYSMVLISRFQYGKSVDEIAEMTGLSRKGVESRILRGRKILKEMMEEEKNG